MKILIICTDNTCRSLMAEGIINVLIKEQNLEGVSVDSMGLSAYDGEKPTKYAVEVMQEIGIDISNKKSKRVMMSDLLEQDLIYVMTVSQKDVLSDAVPEIEDNIRVLDIPDPYNREIDIYREARECMSVFFAETFKKAFGSDDT